MQIIELESVGCGICPCCGNTYPMNQDGSYDLENEVHVSQVDDEWMSKLSQTDRVIVSVIKNPNLKA